MAERKRLPKDSGSKSRPDGEKPSSDAFGIPDREQAEEAFDKIRREIVIAHERGGKIEHYCNFCGPLMGTGVKYHKDDCPLSILYNSVFED